MKKKNAVVSLAAVAALLCVGGGVALGANTTVSASTETKQQIMLGASVLVANEQTGLDSNGIRFPVVVTDEVKAKITESKTYVLPAEFWTGDEAPTADEIKAHASTVANDTTQKWVNYYEENAGYGDGYEEAVVYMYNLPDDKYATDFYVCAWMKLNDNTEETSDVVCRSMEDVAVAAVESGAYTTAQLGKYLTQTTYTVNHYLKTIYGNYVLTGEATTVDAYVGFTATGDEVDGYTYNAALTKEANDGLTVAANGATTVNCYYENDAYAFNKTYLTGGSTDKTIITTAGVSIVSEVADLAQTDIRDNVIKYETASGNEGHVATNIQTRSFSASWIGKYMLFNAYFTTGGLVGITDTAGFVAYGNSNTTTPLYAKGIYNQEGKLYAASELTEANETGKWITFAHYFDPAYYSAEGNEYFVMSFANWHGCTAYIGESVVITAEQYKANFEQRPVVTSSVEGVTAYTGNYIETCNTATALGSPFVSDFNKGVTNYNKAHNGSVAPSSAAGVLTNVDSFAAGSYLAFRIYSDYAETLSMYGATSKEIYANDGTYVGNTLSKNWYTYIFYFANAVTNSGVTSGLYFSLWSESTAIISEIYVINDATAYAAFKTEKGLSSNTDVKTYYPTAIAKSGITGANNANISLDSNGYRVYTTTTDLWYNRGVKLLSSYTAGQYVAMELYSDDVVLNTSQRQFWGGTVVGIYDKETKTLVENANVTMGKWYIAVWSFASDISGVSQWGNQIAFGQVQTAGLKVLIGRSYVFTNETAFNAWIA